MHKKCSMCKIEKLILNFSKLKSSKDGYKIQCKECLKKINKKYSIKNRDKLLKKSKEWYWKYREENRTKAKLRYQLKNKNKIELRKCLNTQKKIKYSISRILRRRFWAALKNNQKKGSAVRDLGCSIVCLKLYLENQFLPGMTWENHGKWHIDHVIPISKFDLTNETEIKEACHYLNLQPMWAIDNLKKGNKI